MFRVARPKGAGGLPCKAYQLPDHQVGGECALYRNRAGTFCKRLCAAVDRIK